MESSTTANEPVRSAHFGRPRIRRVDNAGGVVRVELRLPRHIASVLFERAEESGRTVSRVGGDAIWQALAPEDSQM